MAETKNPNQIVVNHSKNVFPEGETYTLYDLQSGSNGWRPTARARCSRPAAPVNSSR